jgi:hypothetical protein
MKENKMELMMSELEVQAKIIEAKMQETLDLMYLASRKYLEVVYEHNAHDGMDDLVSEDLLKLEYRYDEIRSWLAAEYLARFNAEMFFDAIQSLAIYPTKLPTVLNDKDFTVNREDYVDRFFGEQLGII